MKSFANPRGQVIFNGVLCVVWLSMIPVTLLVPWFQKNILYVALLSVWALFATHLGAWIAALVNVKASRIDDRTEQNNHLLHIEQVEERLLVELSEMEAEVLARMERQHDEMLGLLRAK